MEHYNVGDTVWLATYDVFLKTMECPECCGKRYITVIMGDGSEHTIPCVGCSSGLEAPKGYVTYKEREPRAEKTTIDEVSISLGVVKYKCKTNECMSLIAYSEDVFVTKEEAEVRAKEKADAFKKEQEGNGPGKEYQHRHRTWAWHVYYYRKMIRDAKTEIEYAESRLAYAKTKAK